MISGWMPPLDMESVFYGNTNGISGKHEKTGVDLPAKVVISAGWRPSVSRWRFASSHFAAFMMQTSSSEVTMKVPFTPSEKVAVTITWLMRASNVQKPSLPNATSPSLSYTFPQNPTSQTPSHEEFSQTSPFISSHPLLYQTTSHTGSNMPDEQPNAFDQLMAGMDIMVAAAEFWSNMAVHQDPTCSAVSASFQTTRSHTPQNSKTSSQISPSAHRPLVLASDRLLLWTTPAGQEWQKDLEASFPDPVVFKLFQVCILRSFTPHSLISSPR